MGVMHTLLIERHSIYTITITIKYRLIRRALRMLKNLFDAFKKKPQSPPKKETPQTDEVQERVSAQISNMTLRESINDHFDLSSVMDDLSPTKETIIKSLMENTNAEKAIYIQKRDNQWFAILMSEFVDETIQFTHNDDNAQDNQPLPTNIINFVARSSEPLILTDAMQDENIVADDYLKQNMPSSILCFPITDEKNMEGIIYLENSKMKGAFTEDHLKIIKMLVPLQTMWAKSGNNQSQ